MGLEFDPWKIGSASLAYTFVLNLSIYKERLSLLFYSSHVCVLECLGDREA